MEDEMDEDDVAIDRVHRDCLPRSQAEKRLMGSYRRLIGWIREVTPEMRAQLTGAELEKKDPEKPSDPQ